MPHWVRTLDISDDWKKASDGKISPRGLARVIAHKLKELDPINAEINTIRASLITQFEDAAQDEILCFNDLDVLLDRLYDWGDISLNGKLNGKLNGRKVCWIKTW